MHRDRLQTRRPALLIFVGCLLAGGALLWWSSDTPRGPPHPDLYGIPPPLPPFPPLPPLRNQGLVGVTYSDAQSGVFLGSPSIARLDADTLLISHDFFPEWGRTKRTSVYASKDGSTWHRRATVERQFWSTLFVHRGAAYLLGVDDAEGNNSVSIARSLDGGVAWNRSTVLPAPAGCHWATGSVPVWLHQGTLYRGMELVCDPQLRWPQSFQAVMIHAPAAADLLDPASWHASAPAGFDSTAMLPAWMPGPVDSGGFLEGNAVALPSGRVGLLLRCRVYDAQGRTYTLQHACMFHLEPPPAGQLAGGQAANASGSSQPIAMEAQEARRRYLAAAQPSDEAQLSQPQPQPQPPLWGSPVDVITAAAGASAGTLRLRWQGFVEMPGGGNKFTARLDPTTGLYLALTNPSIDRYGANSDARNILALVYSKDLLSWRVAATLLVPNDGLPWDDSLWRTAYQYPDWIIDGPDLLVAIRTAWGAAASFHDNNWLTFMRVANYRSLLPAATAVVAAAA